MSPQAARDDPAAGRLPGGPACVPWRGLATVAFLGVAAGVQMSDRGVQALLSPAIRRTFGVGDALIGALHGVAGILIASALAMPLARLADRHSRKRILLALIAAWALLTLLGGLAPNFPLFFLGRAAAGITEFAMIPVVYSLIPDLVAERLRVPANLMFAALMAMGASAGFYFGGHLLQLASTLSLGWLGSVEPWRNAMVLLASAAIPLLIVGVLIRDPPRTSHDADASTRGASLLAFVRAHAREIACFVGAAGGLAVAVQALTPMVAMALGRRFSADIDVVGHTLGVYILLGNLGSLPLAWLLDRMLRARLGTAARPTIMAVASLVSRPCAALLAFASGAEAALELTKWFLLATCVANALIPTMVQDLVPAELRARAFAAYSFVIAAFCALGPLVSGGISEFVLGDDLLTAIALAATPMLAVTLVCTAVWLLSMRRRGGGIVSAS